MGIKRHKRRLASGEERTYIYEIDGEERRTIGSIDGSFSPRLYRVQEKNRIVASLQAASSLLVVGEPGCGKTLLGEVVVEELQEIGFPVAMSQLGTAKQTLKKIAEQFGIESENLEGKALTTQELQEEIAQFLSENTAFLVCDNAHRLQLQIRCWLEKLHAEGQPMLLLASYPPARDIFLKLPRIELPPLSDREIREVMQDEAADLELELSNAQLAHLQQRCGGNPMLAKKVIREEQMGLKEPSPDHTQWIDGTPFLIAGLMVFTIVRFVGLGLNSTSLYLIGGIMAVVAGIIRLILYSLPRKSGRLGR